MFSSRSSLNKHKLFSNSVMSNSFFFIFFLNVSMDAISSLARRYSSSNCPPQWQLRKIVFRVRLYASARNSLKLLQDSIRDPHTSILEIIVFSKLFSQHALISVNSIDIVDNLLILFDEISHRTNQFALCIKKVNILVGNVPFKIFKCLDELSEIGNTQL